jgi:hypothetical protein
MVVVQSKVFSFSLRPGQWDYLGLRGLRSRARVLQRVHRSEAQTLDGGCRPKIKIIWAKGNVPPPWFCVQSFPRLYGRHPHRQASIRTLNGPLWVRCNLGSDFKPGSITVVTSPTAPASRHRYDRSADAPGGANPIRPIRTAVQRRTRADPARGNLPNRNTKEGLSVYRNASETPIRWFSGRDIFYEKVEREEIEHQL